MSDEKQKNSGEGSIQIKGDNNTIHQHRHRHQHDHQHSHHTVHAHGPLHIDTLVVQQSDTFALQAPPAPPARKPRPPRPAYDLSPAQRELLALMRPLPKPVRLEVLNWLRCEFGTSMVMELEPRELYQTRQHVLDVRRAAGV